METKAESLKQSFSIGSQNQEYETPDPLFSLLNDEFHFAIDICASQENNKLERYYSKQDDCFTKDWSETSWINPEFMVVKKYIKKAFEDSTKFGSTIVMLTLSKTNTNWWRDYVMKAKEVRFINQKLQFKNTKQGLRFPACIIVFQPHEGNTEFFVMNSSQHSITNVGGNQK